MKIIKLFLLLSLAIWAKDMPNTLNENEVDTKLLQNVVENGWSDRNETLNKFIISYKEKALPTILNIIDKPIIKVEPTKDDVDPVPDLKLVIRDYWNLLSYLKYLENIGELEKALNIYIRIFEGLNNIDDKSILSMIYRIEMEKITIASLNQALKTQSFTHEQKKYVNKRLSDILLFDTKIFFDALESDRIGIIRLLKSSKNFQSEFGKKAIEQVDTWLQEHNEEYHSLKTEQELKEFDKKFSEIKKWFLEEYEQSEHKKLSYDKRISFESGLITFEAARCIRNTKIDLWKNIEANEKLLETLN